MFNIRQRIKNIVREVIMEDYGDSLPISIEAVAEKDLSNQDKADIKQALADLAAGNFSGPFSRDDQIQAHFDAIPH